MKRITKIGLPLVILVTGFLTMVGLLSLRSETPKRPPEVRAKLVETAVVTLGSVPVEIIAYGRVTSAEPVEIYAEVTGTLQEGEVPFKPAQTFKRGDLLAKIDDRQARLDLNSRKSELMAALANVLPEIKIDFPDQYQLWYDYFNSLEFDRPFGPLPETDNAKIKLFLSRFNVYTLYFSVLDLEILLDKHYFSAPFDGSIVSVDLRVGSTARSGSMLGRIINLEQMEVALPVKADDIQWIDRRRPVTLTSTEIPGQWTARVTRVGSNIDTRTQTVDVFLTVDGDHSSLLSGAFMQAQLPGRGIKNAFALPPKALYEDKYVYVVADGKLQRREVVILRREAARVILDGGVEDGDTLVTEVMQGVAPGMPAQPRLITSVTPEQ